MPKRGYRLRPGMKPYPAPGDLRLVQDFVNTLDLPEDRDDLASPQDLETWLSRRGLLAEEDSLRDEEWRQALDLREALRAVIRCHNRGAALDRTILERLNGIVAQVVMPHRLRFLLDGSTRYEIDATGWLGAIAGLLGHVVDAVQEGRWVRLKECHGETCRRIFYDGSSNRVGKWCNSRRCANRVHTRKYRRRGPTWGR